MKGAPSAGKITYAEAESLLKWSIERDVLKTSLNDRFYAYFLSINEASIIIIQRNSHTKSGSIHTPMHKSRPEEKVQYFIVDEKNPSLFVRLNSDNSTTAIDKLNVANKYTVKLAISQKPRQQNAR